jgi:hypothetical protein
MSTSVITEATTRDLPGALGALPSGDQFLDAHLDMKCEFVLDVPARVWTEQSKEAPAAGHGSQA